MTGHLADHLGHTRRQPRCHPRRLRESWLGSCYTDSILIDIRRETGADNGSLSIRRSLAGLAANSRMARRDWYAQQIRQRNHQDWGDWDHAHLAAAFNIFAEPGQPFATRPRVGHNITALEALICRLNAYTTWTIAHRDDNPAEYLQPRRLSEPRRTPRLARLEASTRSTTGYVTQKKHSVS